ncbi:MAG: hypothetical protein E5X86_11525 [Mesorhizobium sp.]|uniref:acyl-homoserine-lactone synthase n=1 Tax=Mesorhizobium sp. TaxID=1871066 RepID=UPI001229EC8F|nr:MAG: hypothetical protein E5X86_11525 [Mesorhizobium sp.]
MSSPARGSLPVSGPTMLVKKVSAIAGDQPARSPCRMVESSRFCVDISLREGRGGVRCMMPPRPCSRRS